MVGTAVTIKYDIMSRKTLYNKDGMIWKAPFRSNSSIDKLYLNLLLSK